MRPQELRRNRWGDRPKVVGRSVHERRHHGFHRSALLPGSSTGWVVSSGWTVKNTQIRRATRWDRLYPYPALFSQQRRRVSSQNRTSLGLTPGDPVLLPACLHRLLRAPTPVFGWFYPVAFRRRLDLSPRPAFRQGATQALHAQPIQESPGGAQVAPPQRGWAARRPWTLLSLRMACRSSPPDDSLRPRSHDEVVKLRRPAVAEQDSLDQRARTASRLISKKF